MSDPGSPRPLIATYRLQLNADFGFDDAVAVLDHLSALGVSHVYTSPLLTAAPGSTHGYDVVDHDHVNPELGGEEGFRRLVEAAHERGLGVVVDIVPNHMATDPSNRRWWDVLRYGRTSEYASWFDIDWEHGSDQTSDRLLLAVLGDHYGTVVRDGQLQLAVDRDGSLVVRYYEHAYPMSDRASERLRREAEVGGQRIEQVLASYNKDPERLHQVLEQQHYRLAHWTAGSENLDYRRFFDVSDLIGVQMQDDAVFAATHARTLQWAADGDIDGIRIDHPDGLADPTGYLATLRRHAPGAWIVVEKILAADEVLPDAWPVDGTTGYETLILLDRVFVDQRGEAAMTALLAEHTGIDDDFPAVRQRAKEDVIQQVLLAEVHRLTRDFVEYNRTRLDRVDSSDYHWRAVISAFLVEFPVYRTYVRDGDRADARDSEIIKEVRRRVHRRGTFDPALVDAIADALLGPLTDESAIRFRRRFQQTTGPVMAKGVEDTAFYRYPRLVSQNEVGGEPDLFGVSLDEFHAAHIRAAEREPRRMIAMSTHDTKRSEDVRARIAVLSEVPDAWAEAARAFTSRAAALADGAQDLVVEYLLHQTLVGAFPISAERAVEYARKAARESKTSTSWLAPDTAFEDRLFASIGRWLHDDEYLAAMDRLLAVITLPGRVNGLAEKLLAMTIPGVPDLYQGSELWTAELVDPDNRRPVDFDLRRSMVETSPGSRLDLTDEGAAKLHVVRAALAARRRRPEAFAPGSGTYEPLRATGDASDHVVAFVRGDRVATVVPRWSFRLEAEGGWRGTELTLPDGRWRDVLTGSEHADVVAVGDVLSPNPVALLERI